MVDYIVRLHDMKLEDYLALDDPSPRDGSVVFFLRALRNVLTLGCSLTV